MKQSLIKRLRTINFYSRPSILLTERGDHLFVIINPPKDNSVEPTVNYSIFTKYLINARKSGDLPIINEIIEDSIPIDQVIDFIDPDELEAFFKIRSELIEMNKIELTKRSKTI